jgi:hypothetical protein
MERVGEETLATLDPHDFLILGLIASGKRLPTELQPHVSRLLEMGVLDRTGRGKPVLSRKLSEAIQTRSPGAQNKVDARARNKARLLDSIRLQGSASRAMEDLMAEFPSLSRSTIKRFLDDLRSDGLIHSRGLKRSARWFPGSIDSIGPENPKGGPNPSHRKPGRE